MIWLQATLLAALLQSWRTAVQQRVRAELSVNAAGLVRYLYGLPVGIVLLTGYATWSHQRLPDFGLAIVAASLAAGLAQIIGTNLLLMAFGYRNYLSGTAYAKTEALQGALLAWLLLGEVLSWISWLGIAIGVAGVMVIAMRGGRISLAQLVEPAALCGLGAGLGFTMTSIFVRMATNATGVGDKIMAALFVLSIVQAGQTLMQGSYVWWRERDQVGKVFASWRTSGQVGVLAALGSACWFTGFALAPVALVRAVGQAEVVFTTAFSRLYLKERVTRAEIAGLALVGGGVALALAGSLIRL